MFADPSAIGSVQRQFTLKGMTRRVLPSGAIGHFRCLFLSRPHRLRNTSLNPRGQASPDPSTSQLWFVELPGFTLSTGVMHCADHDPSVLDYGVLLKRLPLA